MVVSEHSVLLSNTSCVLEHRS